MMQIYLLDWVSVSLKLLHVIVGIACGGCRQRIREFSDANTQIMMCSLDGVQQRINLSELLPNSFGPEHL